MTILLELSRITTEHSCCKTLFEVWPSLECHNMDLSVAFTIESIIEFFSKTIQESKKKKRLQITRILQMKKTMVLLSNSNHLEVGGLHNETKGFTKKN